MDVIDELIAHCEAWEPWARVMGNVCAGDAAQALRSLRAELAEVKRDAERYRWLRRHHIRSDPDMSGRHHWMTLGRGLGRGVTAEEAIDAARKGGCEK